MNKLAAAVIHLLLFALVVAIGAYWVVRIFTPQPVAAPPPMAAPPPRDPDPVAAARMFGLVQRAVAAVTNIQVAGIFAAGKDSSAILVIDGKPPRAYVLGQEITAGTTLVNVSAETVTLEGAGGRQELRAPSRPLPISLSSSGPVSVAPAFIRQGNTLSANASSSGPGGAQAAAPIMPAPSYQPMQPAAPPPMQPPQQEAVPGQPQQNTPPVAQ